MRRVRENIRAIRCLPPPTVIRYTPREQRHTDGARRCCQQTMAVHMPPTGFTAYKRALTLVVAVHAMRITTASVVCVCVITPYEPPLRAVIGTRQRVRATRCHAIRRALRTHDARARCRAMPYALRQTALMRCAYAATLQYTRTRDGHALRRASRQIRHARPHSVLRAAACSRAPLLRCRAAQRTPYTLRYGSAARAHAIKMPAAVPRRHAMSSR